MIVSGIALPLLLENGFLPCIFRGGVRVRCADAIDLTVQLQRRALCAPRVEQGDLDTGGAGIDDQDLVGHA